MIRTCSLSMYLPDKCHSSSQRLPTQTENKHRNKTEKLGAVTFALHACFVESTVLQVTGLRFGTILLLAELLPQKHGCSQSCQSYLLLFFPPSLKSAGFSFGNGESSFQRISFSLFFFFGGVTEIGKNWHMCFKGKGGHN